LTPGDGVAIFIVELVVHRQVRGLPPVGAQTPTGFVLVATEKRGAPTTVQVKGAPLHDRDNRTSGGAGSEILTANRRTHKGASGPTTK